MYRYILAQGTRRSDCDLLHMSDEQAVSMGEEWWSGCVDGGYETQRILTPLCGYWFSTDYGILWAWMPRDGQNLWVTRETCEGRGTHVGKISVSKALPPPLNVPEVWRVRRIVMDIDMPGLSRQMPSSFMMIKGSSPTMVVWRAVRTAGSDVTVGSRTVPININPDIYMIWDYRAAEAIHETLDWWRKNTIDMALDIEMRTLRSERTTGRRTVALCTATKNRLWQLKHTLVTNLVAIWPHRGWVRYYIADFGSTDNTVDFIMNTCQPFIRQGLLKVFVATEHTMVKHMPRKSYGHYWHASICKNAIHVQAVEDILVNVDGDNLMGPDFPLHVDDQFQQGFGVIHYNTKGPGTYGRIAYYRADFEYLRGYDEDAFPMGSQDADIIDRLVRLGRLRKNVSDRKMVKAIPNTLEEKISNVDPLYGGLNWNKMNIFNWEIFTRRSKDKQLIRNLHTRRIGLPLALMHAVAECEDKPRKALRVYGGPAQTQRSIPIEAEAWRHLCDQSAPSASSVGGAATLAEVSGAATLIGEWT